MAGNIKEITEETTGKRARHADLPGAIKMKDFNEFDFSLSTGWVSKAFYERTTRDGGAKKVDSWEIVMQ